MEAIKLKPEVKEPFLAALRSGDYAQGRGYLNQAGDGDRREFCCLGVLTDLYVKEKGLQWSPGHNGVLTFGGCSALPPIEVLDWAMEGFKPNSRASIVVPLAEDNNGTYVDCLNDDRGYDFRYIAQLLEEHL